MQRQAIRPKYRRPRWGSQSQRDSCSDSATKGDGRRKMTAGGEFLDFKDGEENRTAVSGGKTAGGWGWGEVQAHPVQCHERDVIWKLN